MDSPSLDTLLAAQPFGVPQDEKRRLLVERTRELSRHHYASCEPYRNVVDRLFGGADALDFDRLEDAPFLPVTLFKTRSLMSVPKESVTKILTSSGTTGQAVSRIYLDAETSQLQTKTLVKIMQHFLGVNRRPMVFLDHPGVIRDRKSSSARGAGILGMLPFGKKPFYALRDDMSLDVEGLTQYLASMNGEPPVFFGFTFMVWEFFVQALERLGQRFSIPDAVMFHSGGWKKLEAMRVGPAEFRERVRAISGIPRVINYYGMVEQVGSVYVENSLHHLHASVFSDIIIRDPETLEPVPDGQEGLIQVVSALPSSYPGHSLLTEDIGMIVGCDDRDAGMHGQYFKILRRVPKADLRGCSDTFQQPTMAAAR